MLCRLDPISVWLNRPPSLRRLGPTIETCRRCADELIACHGYTFGGPLIHVRRPADTGAPMTDKPALDLPTVLPSGTQEKGDTR